MRNDGNGIMYGTIRLGKGLAAVLLGGLVATGCREQAKVAVQSSPPEVVTTLVATQEVVLDRELPGRTAPYLIAEIRPQVSGIIRDRLFTEGADVAVGDILYEIDSSTYQAAHANAKAALSGAKAGHASAVAAQSRARAAVAKARAGVTGAEAGQATALAAREAAQAALSAAKAVLSQAEANATPLRLREARFRELVADKAVSRQDYDDAAAALQQAEAAIQSATAGVQRAAAELVRAEAAIKVAEADIETAKAGLQAAEAEVQSAEAAIQSAQAMIESAEAGVETARINLGYTRITAPISGRIGRSAVTTGALVTAHQPAALATIQQLDPIYVDVPQATAELLRLERRLADGRLSSDSGQSAVRLLLEDGSAYSSEGSLKFRDISVDPSTGSSILRMVFPNPDRILLPNMFVRAVVREGVKKDAILIPQQTVSRNPKGEPLAMIVDSEQKVRQRALVLDRSIGNQWLVTSGLTAGDSLIVEGLQRIRPDMTVKVVPAAAGETDEKPSEQLPAATGQAN